MTNLKKSKENLVKNFNILNELTKKNIKSNYRNSVFGVIWTVLNPMLNMLVIWLVFSNFFGRNDPLYPIYILSGNICFQTFRSATDSSMQTIVNNRGLLSRINVKKELLPLSSIFSSFINSGFSLIAMFVIMFFMQVCGGYNIFGYQMLFIIVMVPAYILFCYGIGLVLATLFVYFRDIKYIYNVFLTLLMYLTPIFYKESLFTNSIAINIIQFNPIYYFLKYFRNSVYMYQYSGIDTPPSFILLAFLYIMAFISITIGIIIFKKYKNKFMIKI